MKSTRDGLIKSVLDLIKRGSFLRFLAAGALNTLLSYGIYLLLVRVFNYQAAYASAYCCGIVIAFWLNSRFVFGTPWSWPALFRFPLVYPFQYAAGALGLWLLVGLMGADKVVAPIIVALVLAPISFLLAGRVLRWGGRDGAQSHR